MNKYDDAERKAELKQFKRELSSCDYWNKKIIRYNLELEAIEVSLYEVAAVSYGDKMNVDGQEINYKIPKSTDPRSTSSSVLNKLEVERKLIEDINRCVSKIDYCRYVLNNCCEELKSVIIRMYVLGEKHDVLAQEIKRSRTQMYRDIDNELYKSLLLSKKRTKSSKNL